MKILIVRFSSIGDIVLTTPVIRCIKEQLPQAEIHYLTKKSFASVLKANPHLAKTHAFDQNWEEVIGDLRKVGFDFVVDLHKNIRSKRITAALKVKSRSFPKLNVQKWLYVNLKWNLMPDQSIVDRYFKAVAGLGVQNDHKGLDYFIADEDKTDHKDIPMSHWAGYYGFVVGGSYATKKLPVEKWRELCALSRIPIILLGGPEDREEADEIAALDPIKIYNSCGKFNINESADLVSRAKLVVSNDTGLMHVAAAFKKPIVSLWGNTTPWMGMFPYYGYNGIKNAAPESLMIENKHLSCRPCSKLGYERCPRKHFKCMNDLVFSEIVSFFKNYG